MMGGLGVVATLILGLLALCFAGLFIAFILVPLFRGLGWLIANLFRAIGWLIAHLFEFVAGVIGDAIRLIGAIITTVVLLPFAPLNVVLGRWSAAAHFANSVKRECRVGAACLYRIVLRRPLKLLWLHGILEGVEERLPEAMAASPGADRPRRRAGQFDGYTIVGSLPGGGSGAKLYIAEPDAEKRRRRDLPSRVVIKSFTLTEGSGLPQIVRESRALECAKQLGLVVDHGMDSQRFFYVMPYHAGEHLGIVTRQLHGEAGSGNLDARNLRTLVGYVGDLLRTLTTYHQGGLWHKDVKPDNVIVHDGKAHLVDLGLVTPLRSAMTLTTHGTEYFRDPEMVRQALRGVKVHQIDGTKFDIYAAGAVLYFVLENTFPPHGGLSKFSRPSPESIRWIVRRAMADYNKRYDSAEAMLRDLEAVTAASDPYLIRPVDLPSMGGAAVVADVVADEIDAPYVEQVAPEPPSPAPTTIPPRLRVTNWWTGAYAIDEPPAAAAAAAPEPAGPSPAAFRAEARAFRAEARELRQKVRHGRLSERKAAREQVRSARTRARDLQKRARTRHHSVTSRAPGEKPGAMLAGICAVVMLGGVLATGGLLRVKNSGTSQMSSVAVVDPDGNPLAMARVDDHPIVMVVDGEDTRAPHTRTQLKSIMQAYNSKGYTVELPDSRKSNDRIATLLELWNRDQTGPADHALEDLLEEANLYGILWTKVRDGQVRGSTLVWSTRPGAEHRRGGVADSGAPLLLVNDHPTKHDPDVQRTIDEVIRRYGWTIASDAEAESAVRPVLPLSRDARIPQRLHTVLAQLGFGGVIQIEAAPGDGPPAERIQIRKIDGEPVSGDSLAPEPERVRTAS